MRRISTNSSAKLEALRACRYFSSLSDEILIPLTEATHLCRYDAGEMVFLEGEPSEGLCIIKQGSVKLYKVSPQGRELIVNTFEDGDSFNEVPVFDSQGNPVSVAALDESEIWVVGADAIRDAMHQHPEVAQAFILNLSQNLRMLVGMVEELSFYQVTTRLARLISNLPTEQLVGNASQRLTQDDLAARVGTVREVVARSLRKLERSGAIEVSRQKIHVINKGRLIEWAHLPYDEV
ncbi:MAG: Crp/Fnr family transcriptional regulator [Anaerolineales bacterium]|nr:Crp/Fnr family transcriptional regulator [Chloroflexota bacterium]MBL7163061.1 Crp/Fnr family transcriptional regulator [Anaerolineales bacterium]